MSVSLKRRLAVLGAVPLAMSLGVGTPTASAAAPVSPADAALSWLAGELAANDGMLTVTFGTDAFPDPGLTIDAILAERAGGRGSDPAVGEAVAAVDAATLDYVTQGSTIEGDRAANATAKALLLQEVLGSDLGDTVDLEADLRSLMATDGDEVGRFNDTDLQGFGNYSNGLGQALGVLALDRTAGAAPREAVDFLTSQQCADGSFRLYYFGYVTSFDPYETVDDLKCTDPEDGDVDATALALQALLAVPSDATVDDAIDAAVGFLTARQDSAGGFFGTGAVNANTTGLAGQALRAAGATSQADDAAAFLAGLQAGCGPDLGAIAYDPAAAAAGVDADRDQWIRATAQGALGLGLPSYGDIGEVPPVTAGLAPVSCTDGPPDSPGAPAVPSAAAPSATVSSGSVRAGDSVTVTASGFQPGEEVVATLFSTPISLGSATADSTGGLVATFTIPADIEPGDHRIELVGRSSGRTVSVAIEVLAPVGVEGSRNLPATGAGLLAQTAVALGLLLVGRASLVGGRWAAGRC